MRYIYYNRRIQSCSLCQYLYRACEKAQNKYLDRQFELRLITENISVKQFVAREFCRTCFGKCSSEHITNVHFDHVAHAMNCMIKYSVNHAKSLKEIYS